MSANAAVAQGLSANGAVAQALEAERQALYAALYVERFDLDQLLREAAHQSRRADNRRLQMARERVLPEATDEEA